MKKTYDARGYVIEEEPQTARRVAERKSAAPAPVVETSQPPPPPVPEDARMAEVKAQIAGLHLLAEQLRNSANNLATVNSVVDRMKATADALSVLMDPPGPLNS